MFKPDMCMPVYLTLLLSGKSVAISDGYMA